MKLALFYHCLFYHKGELRSAAMDIVSEQMEQVRQHGLLNALSEFRVGLNGNGDSLDVARLFIPDRATIVLHGPDSFAENLTIVEIEKFVAQHQDFYILYCHSKGCTHDPASDYAKLSARWRRCMMRELVEHWRRCVADLDAGAEAVGCHWMTGLADGTQNIFAGNFWMAKASYLATLPSIYKRDRIKLSGIASAESRFESEVWIGNGPRLPVVRDYATHGLTACP